MGIAQVFIFIVAGITFAVIMIFGYSTISDFLSTGEKVQFTQFKGNLENSVKTIYSQYGSVRVKKFSIPTKYSQICIVDLDYDFTDSEYNQLCKFSRAACDSWKTAKEEGGYDKVNGNVFLKPISPDIKVFKLKVVDENEESKGFICEKIVQGSFSLVLEGKGDHTEISPHIK